MITVRSLTLSMEVMFTGLACQAATLALGDGFSVACKGPPDLRLNSLDGPEYDLFNMKGRGVVVNFRATWRPPCIEELPTMQKLWEATRTTPWRWWQSMSAQTPAEHRRSWRNSSQS